MTFSLLKISLYFSCLANNDSIDDVEIGICVNFEDIPDLQSHVVVYLMAISVIFIVITLIIYGKIKTLRGPEDIAFMISITCLGSFFAMNCLQILLRNITFVREFFYHVNIFLGTSVIIGYFSWSNVIMANQIRKNL